MHEPPFWRNRAQNERLVANECGACGYVSFPDHQRICKRCGVRDDWSTAQLAERGTVRSYVVQNRLPDEFETPMPVAVVDMPQVGAGESARVYGIFTETPADEMAIGMEAQAVFRRVFTSDDLPVHAFHFTVPRGEQ